MKHDHLCFPEKPTLISSVYVACTAGTNSTLFSIFPLPTTPAPPLPLPGLWALSIRVSHFSLYYFYNFKRQLMVAKEPDQQSADWPSFCPALSVGFLITCSRTNFRGCELTDHWITFRITGKPGQPGSKNGQRQKMAGIMATDRIQWERQTDHYWEQEATS